MLSFLPSSSEVDIRWREIVQALMVALVIIMLDEERELLFELPREIIAVQEDPVLERLMPPLDFPLCLGMVGGPADMLYFLYSSHSARPSEK